VAVVKKTASSLKIQVLSQIDALIHTNSESEHIVEFCAKAETEKVCTSAGSGSSWRSLHCEWNVNKFEMVFDERHEENNDEDYVDEVSDQLAVWLKTPNARYNDIPEMKLNKLASMKIGSAANCSVACL